MIIAMITTSINIASCFYRFYGNIIQSGNLPPNAYFSTSFLLSSLRHASIPIFFNLGMCSSIVLSKSIQNFLKERNQQESLQENRAKSIFFVSFLVESHKMSGQGAPDNPSADAFLDLRGLCHNIGIPPKSPLGPSLTNFSLSTCRLSQKKSVSILNFII